MGAKRPLQYLILLNLLWKYLYIRTAANRRTDRQADRQANRQTDRQTDSQDNPIYLASKAKSVHQVVILSTDICRYARTYVCLSVHTYVHTYVRRFIRTCIQKCVRICVRTNVHIGTNKQKTDRQRRYGGSSGKNTSNNHRSPRDNCVIIERHTTRQTDGQPDNTARRTDRQTDNTHPRTHQHHVD